MFFFMLYGFYLFFFFFQAEDGIRDKLVTGVQTCALPILHLIARGAPGDEPKLRAALETALRELGVEAQPGVAFSGIVTGHDLVEKSIGDRSEERRVGKECRSRWSADH